MPSLIPGYEYDIFISYRQKDNQSDQWVTKFIESLKEEINATFKEDISIYFDENPHDGLHEHHEVDDSLREKLKCLIFIPIVSQTYCDPKCFAWEHEFKVFVEQAGRDQFGLKTKLSGGNVASRVLPVKIHDLDSEDEQLFESEVGGVMRSIDFIYKGTGVNRPLRDKEEHPDDNINRTIYRDQINKVANAIKDILGSLTGEEVIIEDSIPIVSTEATPEEDISAPKPSELDRRNRLNSLISYINAVLRKPITSSLIIISMALIIIFMYSYPRYFNSPNESVEFSKSKKQFHILFPEESPLALLGSSASEFDHYPSLSLSSDGNTLCFVGMKDEKPQLFIRYLDSPEIIPIEGTEDAKNPFFSPNGKWIAYFSERRMKKIMLPDGNPVDIIGTPSTLRGGAIWAESDEIIFSTNNNIYHVSSRGGEPKLIIARGFDVLSNFDIQISISPDEKYILYPK